MIDPILTEHQRIAILELQVIQLQRKMNEHESAVQALEIRISDLLLILAGKK